MTKLENEQKETEDGGQVAFGRIGCRDPLEAQQQESRQGLWQSLCEPGGDDDGQEGEQHWVRDEF